MISLFNISKTFGTGGAKTIALHDLSLDISKGELLAIMGPSGSGKSTLLNIIGCLEQPSGGTYLLNGVSIQSLSTKKNANLRNEYFGFIVQDFALIEHYTAEKNITLPLTYSKKKINAKQAVDSVMKELNISSLKKQLCCTMSGGQRQRVAIARALINEPEIILADEPTGSLDSKTGQDIMDLFKQIHKQGKTVIIVTHDERVAKQCDRIVHIVDGTLYTE